MYFTLINVVFLDLLTSTGKLSYQLYVGAWCHIFKFCCATYWHFHSKMQITVPKLYIKKKIHISTKTAETPKKKPRSTYLQGNPLTLKLEDLSYNCFCSTCETTWTGSLQSEKKENEQKRPWYSTKQSVLWLLIWSAYNLQKNINQIIRKLFRLTDWSDQNIQKHGD